MSARGFLLSLACILFAGLLMTWGWLLAFRKDTALWFHDTFIDRSAPGRKAEWREHVHELQYTVLGLIFFGFGVGLLMVLAFR